MREWFQEVRYAMRTLRRAPGFTLVAVLSLGLGVGANTAVFGVVNAVLLEPLPVRDPDQLRVAFWRRDAELRSVRQRNSGSATDAETGQQYNSNYSYASYLALRDAAASSADVMAFSIIREANVGVDGHSSMAGGMLVSGNYFDGLGVPLSLGRGITPADDRAGAEPVAVLSHGLWRRAFGGDPAILGRAIRVNGSPVVIVGVAAPRYYGVSQGGFFPPADITLPLAVQPAVLPRWAAAGESLFTTESTLWLRVMLRIRNAEDTSRLEQVFTTVIAQRLGSLDPAAAATPAGVKLFSGARGLDSLRDDFQPPLLILTGVVGLVFLIACVNLASLVLARGVSRQHELWVRLALGAGRRRIVRQTMTESMVLAAMGGIAGLVFAVWGGRLLIPMLAGIWPTAVNITLNPRLLLIGLAVSFLAGLLFGLVPSLRLARSASRFVRPAALGAWSPRMGIGRTLIALQIAVSLPLLVGAMLFLRTIHNFAQVELGFNPTGLVLFRVDPTLNSYSRERTLAFYQRVLARLEGVPGVTRAALVENALVSGWTSNSTIDVEGERRRIQWNHVSPGFFETMGIRIVAGRGIGLQDGPESPRVAVVNESAARTFFGGAPLGRRFSMGSGPSVDYEVVGVAQDGKYDSLRRETSPTMYLPYTQFARINAVAMHVMVRAAAAGETAERLRSAVADVDPDVPIAGLKTQVDQIDETISRERVFSVLLMFFGGFALLLACIGLHGVTAYAVARRTSEIGIRMALGAQRRSVLWLVLRQVVVLAACGLLAGIPAAIAAAQSVRALLFGVAPGDPLSVAAGALLLFAVALGSGFFPALRASRMDPLKALKVE